MARMPDLVPFAQRHGLKIGTIEDLIAYRISTECLVKRVAQTTVESGIAGSFTLNVYTTTVEPVEHLALVKGDLSAPGPVLVRVHAVNVLGDLLGVGEPVGADSQVAKAMRAIEREGRGVIVLIRDLGPKSVSDWVNRRSAPAKSGHAARGRRQVEIGVGSQILRDLGVHDMTLLTNKPTDVYVGLEAYGLRIVGTRAIE
jgi:3,4-dihydroxy 2-butanone 4-phosphate synthase/GTP cyclohydrolase II